MTYEDIRRRLVALALIVAAPLTLLSALLWAGGIGVNPGRAGWGSGVEGLVGYFGYTALIPAWLWLADRVGQVRPVLGAAAAVAALLGAAGALANMTFRVVIQELVQIGVDDQVWAIAEERMIDGSGWMLLVVVMTGTFGPLASVLLGWGLRGVRGMAPAGSILIVAGVVFFLGQAAQVLGKVGYPLALALWCVALVPLGVRLWSAGEPAPEVAGVR